MADAEGKAHFCNVEFCHKAFSRPSRLKQHMRIHTGEKPFKCTAGDCEKSYARQAHLKRHLETAHVENEEKDKEEIKCTYEGCAKTYSTNSDLKKHVRRVHTGQFQCPAEGCQKTFHKKTQLRTHEYQHTGCKAFRCNREDCGKTFTTRTRLERHKKIHEGYKCKEEGCEQIFKVWTLLRKHVAVDHVKEFPCKECGKVFYTNGKFRRHSHTHQTHREMYMCPEEGCERAYCDMKNLKAHTRIYHEGHRFKCLREDCIKTFSTKKKMMDHQKMHDPNRPLPKKRKRGTRKISLASRLSLLQDKEGRSMSLVRHPNSDLVSFVTKGEKPATAVRPEPSESEQNLPQLNMKEAEIVEDKEVGEDEESEVEGEELDQSLDDDSYDSDIEKEAFTKRHKLNNACHENMIHTVEKTLQGEEPERIRENFEGKNDDVCVLDENQGSKDIPVTHESMSQNNSGVCPGDVAKEFIVSDLQEVRSSKTDN